MTQQFTYRHWRELQGAMWFVVTVGFGAGALWFVAVMGVCTVLEAYRYQEALAGGGLVLVVVFGVFTLVRTFLGMARTVVEVSPAALTVQEPQSPPRTFPYADIQKVRFASEALGGFHKVADSTRVIEVTTVAGASLRVDIHNGGWGGVRRALARHLPDERLGKLP
jgi:hypothetical protein